MSIQYPATTLRVARETIDNAVQEIRHPTKGDIPASWGMAATFALNILHACQVTESELVDHFAELKPLGEGMSIPGEAAWDRLPAQDKAEIEAEFSAEVAEIERINRAKPDPFFPPASVFDEAIAMVRPPNLAKEA